MRDETRAIIFDFFGVICSEIAPFWLARYFPADEAVRVKRELVSLADVGRIGEAELFERLGTLAGVPARQVLEDWLELAVIDRETAALLAPLRERVPVALLSNAPGEFLHRLLRREALYGSFDAMLISSEAGLVKPDPAIYLRLCGQLRVSPGSCVMIDDNPANIRGAGEAGIPGILYRDALQLAAALDAWLDGDD